MPYSHDPIRRLVAIDSDPHTLALIQDVLRSDFLEIFTSSDCNEGLALIREKRPHIVLLDKGMPNDIGIGLLEQITDLDPGIETILMAGQYDTEFAVEAIKKGACDYLGKPISIPQLRKTIENILIELGKRRESSVLDEQLLQSFQLQGMVGRSPLMLDLFRKIRRVAPHFRTALLLGETGTGKELAAKALHRLSNAASGPFVACNCGAIVEGLAETELFGCVKGAYTGATQDRVGLFEHANGGTILLDEIGELSLATQTKLLRVLQNQEIRRVGSTTARKIDVLVLGATHRDLPAMVRQGTFREDLYYRLSMMTLSVPSLVERKEDLPLLTRHFIHVFSKQYKKQVRGLTRRAQVVLGRHSWPGNIRELENVLNHGCMLADGNAIDVRDLPDYMRNLPEVGLGSLLSMDEVQKRHARLLVERMGNKKQAAELLGISRTKLYDLLAK